MSSFGGGRAETQYVVIEAMMNLDDILALFYERTTSYGCMYKKYRHYAAHNTNIICMRATQYSPDVAMYVPVPVAYAVYQPTMNARQTKPASHHPIAHYICKAQCPIPLYPVQCPNAVERSECPQHYTQPKGQKTSQILKHSLSSSFLLLRSRSLLAEPRTLRDLARLCGHFSLATPGFAIRRSLPLPFCLR